MSVLITSLVSIYLLYYDKYFIYKKQFNFFIIYHFLNLSKQKHHFINIL
jgi:hypothetical protein